MLRPRFEVVSLRYGCHEGEWQFPDVDRPVVISGPNGSGKTTLVDGLVRTLFGFDRRRAEDANELAARRPWDREGMRGRVVLSRSGDQFEIRRDFETDRVAVYEPEERVEHFAGDGNPAARNQEARHYRQILTDLLGLRDLDAYRQTLLVRQGDLAGGTLGDHLLRVAAGGHSRVEAARHQIAQAHRATTRRSIHSGAAPAINPRELEKLEEEIATVRARLQDAQVAGERRTPLALDRDRVAERLARLDDEIVLLENALSALARTDATELSTRRLRQQIRELEEAAETLQGAAAGLDAATEAHRESLAVGEYPPDVPERIARAEVWWQDLEELRGPPAPWLGILTLLLLAGAGTLFALGYTLWSAVPAGAGALAAVAWGALWLWTRRRRKVAARNVGELLDGIPDGESLGPATSQQAVARQREQEAATSRLLQAREALAEALLEARAVVREADSGPMTASETDPDRDRAAGARARRLVTHLEESARRVRERLAAGRTELDRIGDLSLALPDGVPPTEASVSAALRERRAERSKAQESLRDVSQELLERGTPSESTEALAGQLASLEPRREALVRKAEVFEAAHALIIDAYDEFRDRDQDRLAAGITDQVRRLSNGRLDGIEVDGSLDEAQVRTDGRLVPMTTPPLSFGEFHALQLGVRLGAAEFLAGIGILPPLLIDEPFAHLDSARASAVWGLLLEVAETRQVIVTTQDARLLDDLAIEPDIRLMR